VPVGEGGVPSREESEDGAKIVDGEDVEVVSDGGRRQSGSRGAG